MLIVEVKDGEVIDKVLKKYKRKFEKAGILKELRRRKAFSKPSVQRRTEVLKAVYKAHGNNHNSHADSGGANGQPDNKFRKCFLPVKGYAFCYEDRNIQTA